MIHFATFLTCLIMATPPAVSSSAMAFNPLHAYIMKEAILKLVVPASESNKVVRKDLTGKKFGRLEVLRLYGWLASRLGDGTSIWECQCACGNKKLVRSICLTRGANVSCGCYQSECRITNSTKHGHARKCNRSGEYSSWARMRDRCSNPKTERYPHYGGRGIKVCERWLDFELFLSDMGNKPTPKHSIDRIDNDGNYEPSNCRWATALEQQSNTKRSVKLMDHNGKVMILTSWARYLHRDPGTIRRMVSRGELIQVNQRIDI